MKERVTLSHISERRQGVRTTIGKVNQRRNCENPSRLREKQR
jgi:hypothetical protein